jgi:hypothetical protein
MAEFTVTTRKWLSNITKWMSTTERMTEFTVSTEMAEHYNKNG